MINNSLFSYSELCCIKTAMEECIKTTLKYCDDEDVINEMSYVIHKIEKND